MKYLITFLLSVFIVSSQVPTDGLIGYWPFNGNANDYSGFNKHGEVYNATLDYDRFGNKDFSYNFQTKSNIKIPVDLINNDFTYSFWFKSINQSNDMIIFDFRGISNNSWETLDLSFNNSNELRLRVRDSLDGISQDELINKQIIENKWYHIAIVYNNSDFSIYIDSDKILEFSNNETKFDKFDSLMLGSNFIDDCCYFNGNIDDIRLYNKALSNEEISLLYNEYICFETEKKTIYDTTEVIKYDTTKITKYDTLISKPKINDNYYGYWPFDKNANDHSGNDKHGNVNDAELSFDRFGNEEFCYLFGEQRNIEIPVDLDIQDFSFSLWFNAKEINENDIIYDLRGEGDNNWETLDLSFNEANKLRIRIRDKNDEETQDFILNENIETNKWYHFVFQYKINEIDIYLNGKYSNSFSTNEINIDKLKNLMIGSNYLDDCCYFEGKIDDVRLYTEILEQKEILALCDEKKFSNHYYLTLSDTITVYDSVSVTDTLVIDVDITNVTPNIQITIKAYPNPTNNELFFEIYGDHELLFGNYYIITDLSGKELYKEKIDGKLQSINLNEIGSKGTYILIVADKNLTPLSTKKIILK